MHFAALSRRCALIAAAAFMLAPGAAIAEDWPKAKPIRVMAPFGVGSATDIIARVVMDEVGRQIGATVVPRTVSAPVAPSAPMRWRNPIRTGTPFWCTPPRIR